MTNFDKSYFSVQNIPANLKSMIQYILTVEVQPIIDGNATEDTDFFSFAIISNGETTTVLNPFRFEEQNITFPAIKFNMEDGDSIPTRLFQAEMLTSFINFDIESVYWHDNEEFYVVDVKLYERSWKSFKYHDNGEYIDATKLIQYLMSK